MRVKKGDNIKTARFQPGRTITETTEGTLEGSVVWIIDSSLVPIDETESSNLLPVVALGDGQPGGLHPDDSRLECYNRTLTYGSNGILTCTASYFGLTIPKTDYELSFTGGTQADRIETHKDFEDFAGKPGSPENGAKFDEDTGEFLGFTEFVEVGEQDNKGEYANFLGVQNYLVPTTTITISWWQDSVPVPSKLAVVEEFLPYIEDVRKPKGVKNFLLVNETYNQVGNFYQITQNYLGSSIEGGKGWNKTIYDTEK